MKTLKFGLVGVKHLWTTMNLSNAMAGVDKLKRPRWIIQAAGTRCGYQFGIYHELSQVAMAVPDDIAFAIEVPPS